MSVIELLFTWNGKISRTQFWIYIVCQIIAFLFIAGVTRGNASVMFIAGLISIYPTFCIFTKRGNDLNLPRWISRQYAILPFITQIVYDINSRPFQTNTFLESLLIIGWLVAIVGIIHLGFIKGSLGQGDKITDSQNSSKENTPSSNQEPKFHGERDLSNDAYKIFLTKHYSIKFNDVLKQYECSDRLFSSIDECLDAAHKSYNEEITSPEFYALVKDKTIKNYFEMQGITAEKYSNALRFPTAVKAEDGVIRCSLCDTRNWNENKSCKMCGIPIKVIK
jgi:uncharacterized membrane protein YhaH (DUF805 family)